MIQNTHVYLEFYQDVLIPTIPKLIQNQNPTVSIQTPDTTHLETKTIMDPTENKTQIMLTETQNN